jgi:hypothetical protein
MTTFHAKQTINMMKDIIDKHSFEDCYNKIHSLSYNDKLYVASFIVTTWVNNYINNPNEQLGEQCKFFISCLSDEDKILLINNHINNDKFENILSLFEPEFIKKNKNELFFNNIDCLNYMINNFGYYDLTTINNVLYNMAVNYYYVDTNIVEWIINNYNNFIKYNIDKIIINIMQSSNYANINNCYLIIEQLLKIEDIDIKCKLHIFKQSIYDNHVFIFDLFINNFYDNINIINMFEFVCYNTNPNLPIHNTLVPYLYQSNNILHNYNFEKLYNKLKENNINNIVEWFNKYFDNDFKLLLNDIYYMFTDININKGIIDNECMICYENNKNMVVLNCCSSHITCSSCLKQWTSNNNTCPMCRKDILLNKSSLYVN